MRRDLLKKKRLLKAYINDLKKVEDYRICEKIKELKQLYEYYENLLKVV